MTKQKVQFTPLSDRVLLRRLAAQEKQGSIILPDSAKKKQETAEVVAIGPGKKSATGIDIPMNVSLGDIVLIDKYSSQEVTIHDEEFVVVRADDIIAIIER